MASALASSFMYHPSLIIGIGELGNRTLGYLHDTLPQHEPFVQLRGFHLAPAKGNAWSYDLDTPQAMSAFSRVDVRERYLWHLQHRQAALFGHIQNAVTHLKEAVYVYFFTDLQDPLSALLLDIVHLVRYVLTQHNPKMAIRPFIYVATPSANAYDAGQFATLREWLRFTYEGIDQPKYLFHPTSPFAFLNDNHAVLFNRLFLYQPHPQLAQLWAEIGVAQLQDAPPDIPDRDVYSREFIEHRVSNFSSTTQMQRITLNRDIQALPDESLLMCSAYTVYSIGLPKTYLHHTWRMTYATYFIKRILGVAHPATTRVILHDLAQWGDMPPFIYDTLKGQPKPLGQLSEAELHHLFMSSDARSLITDPARQPILAHPNTKIASVTDFIGYYANQNAPILGNIYATDYPTGAYATTLQQCATITVRDFERTIHPYLITDLNDMLTDETGIAGGVASALAWLGALHGMFTRLYKEATWITDQTRIQLQQADALAHTQRQQLIGAGHLTRMGRLSQMAEMYRDSQVRDIQLRGRYNSLCFVQQVLGMLITTTEALFSRLFEMQNHLQALLNDLAQRQARLKRPQSSTFCHWIHDEAWEKDHADFLWQQFGETWRSEIGWSLDEATGQVICRVGEATLRLSSQPAQTLQLDHWLAVVDIQHDDTLWQMYATDALRAKALADTLKKSLGYHYHPLEGFSKADYNLMLPSHTPNETGATTFLAEMNAHTRFSRAKPYITPSGDKIIYLTRYDDQPLQHSAVYGALAEKYHHFADPSQHHLFASERTAKGYEAFVDGRLFAPPIVALFADEARLNLFVLLHALDYFYEQPLDDTMRYLGLQVADPPLPLTTPSHDPNWYDAAYTFVWRGHFFSHPTQPIRYDDLQAVCDTHINTHIQPASRPHWTRIHLLSQTRPSRAPEIRRLGLLLDVYLGYTERLRTLDWGQSRLIADLHGAFLAIALARIDELQSDLGRYNL